MHKKGPQSQKPMLLAVDKQWMLGAFRQVTSAIVYGTGSTAEVADSGADDCVQCNMFGKGQEVAKGFANINDLRAYKIQIL